MLDRPELEGSSTAVRPWPEGSSDHKTHQETEAVDVMGTSETIKDIGVEKEIKLKLLQEKLAIKPKPITTAVRQLFYEG